MKNPTEEQSSPAKGTSVNRVPVLETTNKLRSATDYIQTQNNQQYKEVTMKVGENLYMNSTKVGNKRFTFDPNDVKVRMDLEQYRERGEQEEWDTRIKVFYNQKKYVDVGWNSSLQGLTIGWLISEILRKLAREDDFNRKTQIVGLKNLNTKTSECYDYLLTQLDSNLAFIKDGDSLHIIKTFEKFNLGSMTSFSPVNSDGCLSPVSQQHTQQLSLEDFELIKVIGKGGFSKVFQVRKKDTGKLYAMKTLSKAKIKKDNKVENILNERAILERVAHPFLIKIKYAFQNEDYLFLVIDFCAGGELFFRMNNIAQGRMNEKQAKFYFAEILEALEHLHKKDILYRDLKPENIVLDEKGHVKITDFGLSKLNFKTRDRAFSFCGSPEYMAPEMLVTERNRMLGSAPMYHNKCLDFYHLGALLYEMICGLPPFFSEDREKMYKEIIFSPISIPNHVSVECRSLLKSLLQKNPAKRLGCERGAQEIKDHPWCKGIDWGKVLNKQLQPPFKPFMHKSNFDPEYTSMAPILQDDEPLVALSDMDNESQYKASQFQGGQGTKIIYQDQDMDLHTKLNRQPSIELYERENNTFRGYSFLQEHNHNQLPHGTQYDPDAFIFGLPDSKEHSFNDAIGSALNEMEFPGEEGGQGPSHQEQDMYREMFAAQPKNKQSQMSILSEGVETMKANINQIGGTHNQKDLSPVKVMMDQKYGINAEQLQLKHQQSKESLYNELLSTFDYSINKKDKNANQITKANQTQSTMSLFSNDRQAPPQQQVVLHSEVQDKKIKPKDLKEKFREEKPAIKEKLEFNKINRKYSPEIDMNRVLLQSQHRVPTSNKNQNVISKITKADLEKRPNSNLRSSKLKPLKKEKRNGGIPTLASEYSSTGAGGQLTKKRQSEMTMTIQTERQSNLRGSVKKSTNPPSTKSTFGSAVKPSSTTKNSQLNSTAHLTTLKTSQLYSQVNKKNNNSSVKSRNVSGQGKKHTQTNEECKIASNYQTLQHPNYETENSGQYVVKKINANDYLGSFLTSNSNAGAKDAASSPQKLMDSQKKEAMAAVILNQSHESCCCSDDEFNSKSVNRNTDNQNLKQLQHKGLQDSILANQTRHLQNERQFKQELQTLKDVKRGMSDQDKLSVFQDINESNDATSPIHVEAVEKDKFKNFKSQNPSLIGRGPLERLESYGSKPDPETQKTPSLTLKTRIVSPPTQTAHMLNKTTPISPFRGAGSSKMKERPFSPQKSSGTSNVSGVFALQMQSTPKSNEKKSQLIHNKLAQTVGRLARQDTKRKDY